MQVNLLPLFSRSLRLFSSTKTHQRREEKDGESIVLNCQHSFKNPSIPLLTSSLLPLHLTIPLILRITLLFLPYIRSTISRQHSCYDTENEIGPEGDYDLEKKDWGEDVVSVLVRSSVRGGRRMWMRERNVHHPWGKVMTVWRIPELSFEWYEIEFRPDRMQYTDILIMPH